MNDEISEFTKSILSELQNFISLHLLNEIWKEKGGIMNFQQKIILYVFQQFKGERSMQGAYHILTGKRSQQSIQDAKWYQLSLIYGSFFSYSQKQFKKDLYFLVEHQYLYQNGNAFIVTAKGNDTLERFIEQIPNGLNGFTFSYATFHFFSRLTLYIQSLTNVLFRKSGFVPIINHYPTKIWVKTHFPKTKDNQWIILTQLYKDLEKVLKKIPQKRAELIVYQLSSDQIIGMTIRQLAEMYEEDHTFLQIEWVAGLHQIIKEVQINQEEFKILPFFINDLIDLYPLTYTAKKTWQWLKNGYDIDQIAQIRQLKRSTIEDHLVEITLNVPSFSIQPYVKDSLKHAIENVIKKQQTRKLKIIKQQLDKEVSYFQIRLVLAKGGGEL